LRTKLGKGSIENMKEKCYDFLLIFGPYSYRRKDYHIVALGAKHSSNHDVYAKKVMLVC